jgi:Family of unknown function (DUF6774)
VKSCELVTYVTAIACFISENCPEEDLPIICAMLSQLNDTLRTIIAQNIFCKKELEKILQAEKELEKEAEKLLNKEKETEKLIDKSELSLKDILQSIKKDAET